MKCFILIIFVILLKLTDVVSDNKISTDSSIANTPPLNLRKSDQANVNKSALAPKTSRQVSQTATKGIFIPNYGVVLLGISIAFLFLTVIILLIIIYKSKVKVCCETIGEKFKFTEDDSLSKCERQLPPKSNDDNLAPSQPNDENRFKLQNHSVLTTVDCPNDYIENDCEEPKTRRSLSKVLKKPVEIHTKEYMQNVCQAVLARNLRTCESPSSLYLNEIGSKNTKLSEDSVTNDGINKSASTPLLDIADNIDKVSPSTSVKKLNESSELNTDTSTKKTFQQFHFPNIKRNKVKEELIQDEIYDHPPKNNTNISTDIDNETSLDNIYDNVPSIHTPVEDFSKENDQVDNTYDNPSTIKVPVLKNINEDDLLGEIYDTNPSNKSIVNTKSDKETIDDVYVIPQSNKPLFDETSLSKVKQNDEATDYNDYDLPQQHGKCIVVAKDDNTGYNSPFTVNKKNCFELDYMNARSLNISNFKQ